MVIKNIMSFFGFKVFTDKEYDKLVSAVANCGIYYRSLVDNNNTYHHGKRCVTVPITELGSICLVENCIWEDVKKKIYEDREDKNDTIKKS